MAELFFTSDVHSYYYDTDYIEEGPMGGGYFALARHFSPSSLIIDGGDILQGSPLARAEKEEGFKRLIQAEVMNAAGVGVYVPGNHDFNWGGDLFRRFVGALEGELVCANLVDTQNKIQSKRYHLHRFEDGISVAIVGVVTDWVHVWESEEWLQGLQIADSVEAAQHAWKEVQALRPDYTVLVYHGGYDDTTHSQENRSQALSQIGYDLLLTAHQHMVVPPFQLGTTVSLQAGSRASHYGRVTFQQDGFDARLFACGEGEVFAHPALDAVEISLKPMHDAVVADLKQVIGHTQQMFTDSSKLESALYGSSLADFFNQVQLEYTKADISCVSLFNNPRSLGPIVTAGDLISVYPFPNTLHVLEVNGGVLKQALERCASYFDLLDGKPVISSHFLDPKIEHYNYDFYQNISYTFDISRDVGERVQKLIWQDWDLLAHPEKTLTLALNNYRATGTGGYEIFLQCKVVHIFKSEVQQLLFDTFTSQEVVPTPQKGELTVIW